MSKRKANRKQTLKARRRLAARLARQWYEPKYGLPELPDEDAVRAVVGQLRPPVMAVLGYRGESLFFSTPYILAEYIGIRAVITDAGAVILPD